MKRIFAVLLALVLISCSVLCAAASGTSATKTKTTIEYLENGDYIETIITWEESNTRNTKPATKTAYYKNGNGDTLWSLKVTATFSYDGVSCDCTSARHSTTVNSSAVTINNASSSRSGNRATATATATVTINNTAKTVPLSVTLTCSPTGVLS